jgi:hypothetical protein
MKASTSILAILILTLATELPAQKKDPKPPQPWQVRVSLKGFLTEGGIANVSAGEVRFVDQKGATQRLKPKQQFESGDEIQVGPDSFVEVLLNPGIYLRLWANTRVRFIDLSPDNLKLELINGSIIVENYVAPPGIFEHSNAKQNPNNLRDSFGSGYQGINVMTPQGDFMIARGGLYRCDLDGDSRASLKVAKGLAVIPGNLLSDRMAATLGDRVPTIENYDAAREDDFDKWSHQRAIVSAATNKALRDTPWGSQLRKNDMTYLNIDYDERNARMKEALTISARGGGVGFAEPGAEYKSDEASWQPLTSEVELKPGDRVRTNAIARAEIHLYPDCYLFLNGNTEIVYGARRDAGVAVKLITGSAMMVSSLKRKVGLLTSLLAPTGEFEIPEGGVYRLNVRSPRQAELVVYQGSATIQGQLITQSQRAILSGTGIETGPLRWMDIDPFELWSRKRSQFLILSLSMGAVLEKADTKHRPALVPGSAHRVISSGMWYLFPETDAYTFVPTERDRRSPYGPKYEFWFRTE